MIASHHMRHLSVSNIVITLIVRFVQFIGVMAVLTGISLKDPFQADLAAMRIGQYPVISELSGHYLKFAGPILLGVFLVVGTQFPLRKTREMESRERQFPDKPWLWDPMWEAKQIRHSNTGPLILLGGFWALYLLIMVPAGIVMGSIKLKAGITAFLVAWGWILFVFSKLLWKNRVWNRSELLLGTLPGVVGGPFRGVVILPETFAPGTIFRLTLKCDHRWTFRRKHLHSAHRRTVWMTSIDVDRPLDSQDPARTSLPVAFSIPYSCEPTGSRNKQTWQWELGVRLCEEEDSCEVSFVVPVFRTKESSPDVQLDADPIRRYLAETNVDAVLQRLAVVRRTQTDGSHQIDFSAGNFSMGVGILGLMFASIAGVVAALLYLQAPLSSFVAMVLTVIALASGYGAVELWGWRGRMTIRRGDVSFECGYPWKRSAATIRTQVRAESVEKNDEVHRYGANGNDGDLRDTKGLFECREEFKTSEKAWWCIRARFPDGSRHALIKRLDGEQEARAVQRWLQETVTSAQSR